MRSPASSFNHYKHIDKTRDNKRCPTEHETKQKCLWGWLIIALNSKEEETTEGKEPLFVQATLDFSFEQGTGALSRTAFLIGASALVPIPAGWHLCVFAVSKMCHVSRGGAYPGQGAHAQFRGLYTTVAGPFVWPGHLLGGSSCILHLLWNFQMVEPPRVDVIIRIMCVQLRVWREGASWVTSTLSHFILLYFISLYFILFISWTSGNESHVTPTDPLNSGHLWDHLFLPLSDDLPCRRLMVIEGECRKYNRDAHMVNSKFAKTVFLSGSEACYTALNTLIGVHRDGNAKRTLFICPVFSLFHLCPFSEEMFTSNF